MQQRILLNEHFFGHLKHYSLEPGPIVVKAVNDTTALSLSVTIIYSTYIITTTVAHYSVLPCLQFYHVAVNTYVFFYVWVFFPSFSCACSRKTSENNDDVHATSLIYSNAPKQAWRRHRRTQQLCVTALNRNIILGTSHQNHRVTF